MIASVALAVVGATGLFLTSLGVAALLTPARASRFLLGFAATPVKHFTELALRFLCGAAFIAAAGRTNFASLFSAFGWILVVTTLGLSIVPWQWHRRFAAEAVPRALRFLPLIGIAAAGAGVLILAAVFHRMSLP